jgi:hypothetical protein
MADNSFPKSYRHLITDEIFLDDTGKNIAEELVHSRYVDAFKNVQSLLEKCGLKEHCTIEPELLWRATLDYFEDIARLKTFHRHKHVQTEKIYAYETFWYLRNHPIQINRVDEVRPCYAHINEYLFSYWLIKKMATELEAKFALNIQIDNFIEKFENHDLIIGFREKLYYTFRHRTYTQQSLLLMIEGFMAAAEFTLEIS